MRACKQCGLSIGDTAAFCPVCGALADPEDVSPVARAEQAPSAGSEETPSPGAATPPAPVTASELESAAHACEKADPSRAAALYRQAVVAYLESSDDPLDSRSARRDVQRVFDRLSLVLKREGLLNEALEEIDSAAYLGLVDDDGCGTKAQRDALVKRRDALRRAVAKAAVHTS
jgi:hypothetical protein